MILPFLDEPSTAEELAKRLIADAENEREVCDVASRVIEGVGTKLIERERDGYDNANEQFYDPGRRLGLVRKPSRRNFGRAGRTIERSFRKE